MAELEQALIHAQAEVYARNKALRVARNNVSYILGALDEAKRAAAAASQTYQVPVAEPGMENRHEHDNAAGNQCGN